MTANRPASANLPFGDMKVVAAINRKGGAGKTETIDALEAIATLGGHHCKLVDVDDANAGLARRVGRDNVIKVGWDTNPALAGSWAAAHAGDVSHLFFDLGSGIESADLPILGFLGTLWALLRDRGASITILIVIGTNAHVRNFVERIKERFGHLGRIGIVFNNQDGSRAFPADYRRLMPTGSELGYLPAGIQQVRLMRQEPLSRIISSPLLQYTSATALMARRAANFARQGLIQDMFSSKAGHALDHAAATRPGHLRFSIANAHNATNERIAQNEKVAAAEHALFDRRLSSDQQLIALENYRKACDVWRVGNPIMR